MDLNAQVSSGLRWVVATRLASQGFSWGATIVVIRILSPGDYGLLAMATLFTGFLSMLSEAGLGGAIVQAAALDELVLQKIFGFVLLINLGMCGVLLAAAPFIAALFSEPRLTLVIQTLALSFLLVGFTAIPEALLDRRLEYRRRSLVDLSAQLFGSAFTLGLALGGFGVWSLVLSSIGTAAWRMVGLQWLAPFRRRPVFDLRGLGGMLNYGWNVVLTRLLWYLYSQVDVLIGGKVLGKELLGAYSVAMHLSSLPAQRFADIIYRVSFPAFSKLKVGEGDARSALLKAIRVASAIGFPILWGISSVAPEIVNVILGAKWHDAITPLRLLALMMPLRVLSPVLYSAAAGLGRPDIGWKNTLVALVVMPIALLVGSQWGLTGMSLAWVLVFPFVFLQNMSILLPVARLRIFDMVEAMARPALASAAMYAAVETARILIDAPQVITFALLVFVGALTFVSLMWLIGRKALAEVLAIVRPS